MPEPVKIEIRKTVMNEVHYKCMDERCKAEDHGRFFQGERVPDIINCWKCHGGYGVQASQMIQLRKGMIRVAS